MGAEEAAEGSSLGNLYIHMPRSTGQTPKLSLGTRREAPPPVDGAWDNCGRRRAGEAATRCRGGAGAGAGCVPTMAAVSRLARLFAAACVRARDMARAHARIDLESTGVARAVGAARGGSALLYFLCCLWHRR